MLQNIIHFILYFFIYSFIGWVGEIIYCSRGKKAVNRGFLFGPICPIYAVGSFFILYLFQYIKNPILLFITGGFLAAGIEYIISVLLEMIFHKRWWDYSFHPFNIKGRVCLLNTFLFGIGSLLICYVIEPLVKSFVSNLNNNATIVVAISLFIFFILDLISSVIHYKKVEK